jgi:hypothetical protein
MRYSALSKALAANNVLGRGDIAIGIIDEGGIARSWSWQRHGGQM